MRWFGEGMTAIGRLFVDSPFAKSAAVLTGASAGWLFPDQAGRDAAAAACAMVLLDTATGLWAAVATGRAIRSATFGRVLSKLIGYGAVVATVAIVTRFVPGASGAQGVSVSAAVSLVIVTEAISVLENVRKLGIRLPFGLERFLAERSGGAMEEGR